MIKFILKYWYIILLLVLAFPIGLKLLKEQKTTPKSNKDASTDYFNKIGVPEHKRGVLDALTMQIAHNLGTSYSVFSFRHWTENDLKIYELLKNVSQQDFEHIKQLYFKVYAKGRNLNSDLASMLDDKYYSQLKLV